MTTRYEGRPSDIDVEIANGLVESEKALCQDDAEYVAWALTGACNLCKRRAGIPVLKGLCVECSAAVVYNHGKPYSDTVPYRVKVNPDWDGE